MIPLEPGKYYHIYNHANGHENIFAEDRNYPFFLEKYRIHIAPIASTLAYCLLPNHFHFFVQIREENELTKLVTFPKFETLEKLSKSEKRENIEDRTCKYISKQYANLFSSYTQAFNLTQNRKGSLFYKNFRRKEVTSDEYFIKLVNYIHFNPVIHGFCTSPSDWKYSSFEAITGNKNTLIERGEVIERFGGLDNFFYCHRHPYDFDM
ncbi:transposase [Saccharicrinis sp. FJH62]|uniref:transposase n=1 Tax=Saccharicrinis sp. FJH62 TaxID=3344657 RepID=UPI0035D46225